MCIIFACETKYPTRDQIKAGADVNPHGGGIAWIDRKEKVVKWKKGFRDGDDMLEFIDSGVIKEFPVGIHFRIKTVGDAVPELTHPFPLLPNVPLDLEGSAPGVLFHNGNWSNWWDTLVPALGGSLPKTWPTGQWSDTRAIAWFLARGGPAALELLYEHVRGIRPDRLLILDASSPDEIVTRGHWTQHSGFKSSNDGFLVKKNYTASNGWNTSSSNTSSASSSIRRACDLPFVPINNARSAKDELPTPEFQGIHYAEEELQRLLVELHLLKKKQAGV